ncbi:hypothetical protein QFZ91_007009 [Paraburkholderia sp. JPY419]
MLVLIALWIRSSMEESQEFVEKVGQHGERRVRLPIVEALLRRGDPFGASHDLQNRVKSRRI